MNIKKFITENTVEKCTNLVDEDFLIKVTNQTGIIFGKELTEYLLTYGYLAFEYVELYGINSRQELESDMIKQTLYLHKYFSETAPLVAIENQGDGIYFLADKEDYIFEYDSTLKKLVPTHFTLFAYILHRFTNAKYSRGNH